ncbi:MAG: response regulator transcription factor [Ignavibacteriales bacterium]|nr:response regulator transcription factor [Ignavibacteriales bacterium]
MKPAKILIADDHQEFRKIVSEYLNCLPNVIVVGEAVDGIDAIEKTGKLDPDIVLMDISMPRCNGLDATRIIKAHWPLKKVVIATMHDNPFYHAEAQRAHADGYILKSSLKSSLQAVIDQSVVSLMSMAASAVDTHEHTDECHENCYVTEQVLQEKAE